VAASLTGFSSTARLAFLVVGPMVDAKLVAMQAGTFGRRFAVRFAPATFVVAIGSAVAMATVVLPRGGGTLLKLALTGDYTRYVKVSVRPYLLVAAMVLVVAGATLLTRRVSTVDHDHDHGRFDVAWLLVVPMLAVLCCCSRHPRSARSRLAGP
jgi:hypothetical protein